MANIISRTRVPITTRTRASTLRFLHMSKCKVSSPYFKHHKMAFETVQRCFYCFLRYLGVDTFAEEVSRFLGETAVSQYATIGPEGSSVDAESFKLAGTSENASSTAKIIFPLPERDTRHIARNKLTIGDKNDKELPKVALCADSVSQDLSPERSEYSIDEAGITDEKNTAKEISAPSSASRKRERREDCELDTSKPVESIEEGKSMCPDLNEMKILSTSHEPTQNGCSEQKVDEVKSGNPKVKCSKVDTTEPEVVISNAGGELCTLYRLFPTLLDSWVSETSHSKTQVRIEGKTMFNPPLFSEGDFELRIIQEKVCLEFIQIDTKGIHGYVRVLNMTYLKDVTVYYTKNNWKIVRSEKAKWVETFSDGTMDRFVFTIPGRKSIGNLLFSVTFNGIADNNKGQNYTVAYEEV